MLLPTTERGKKPISTMCRMGDPASLAEIRSRWGRGILATAVCQPRHQAAGNFRTSVQMWTKEHVKRQACQGFDSNKKLAGWQAFAGFPVAPGACGNTKLCSDLRDLSIFTLPPVFEPHTKCDAGCVAVMPKFGSHRGNSEGRLEYLRKPFSPESLITIGFLCQWLSMPGCARPNVHPGSYGSGWRSFPL